ncbi:MAG: anti-sigma factor family protein [Planctomycetota bacterium]
MEHVSEIKLLDYVAGRLSTAETERIRRHIAACPDCASRHEDIARTWNTLGHWQVDSSAVKRSRRYSSRSRAPRLQRFASRQPLFSRPPVATGWAGTAARRIRRRWLFPTTDRGMWPH